MLCAVRDISQLVTKLKQLIVDFWVSQEVSSGLLPESRRKNYCCNIFCGHSSNQSHGLTRKETKGHNRLLSQFFSNEDGLY